MKEFENNLHAAFHFIVNDIVYPLLLIYYLSILSTNYINDGGVVGFILAILIICYNNTYKKD